MQGPSKSYCFVTDGPWPLGQWLRIDARNKGVTLSPHFNKFFDLRTEYSKIDTNHRYLPLSGIADGVLAMH